MKTQAVATLEPLAPAHSQSRWQRCAPWLLIVVGIATYANSLGAPFIFDDVGIVESSYLRTLWPPWRTVFAPPDKPDSGRPVVTLTLLVNYALGGIDVRGYHALNITVHILAGLVLYGVVRRTLLCPALRARYGAAADALALAAALLWLVHPLQTECMDYVSQRSESIMGLLYLLTLYCAIRAAQATRPGRWQTGAIAACALGMASKEVMVTAPLMVLFYDWAFRWEPFAAVWRRRWRLYAGLAATWGVLAALMLSGPRSASVGWHLGISAYTYALDQCLIIPRYLRLVFWPHPLVLDYGEARAVPTATALPYAIGLVVVLTAVAAVCWRRPCLGFAAAWVFVILAPTSSIYPIASEVGAERRMYLPLAGIVVLVVIGVHELLRRANCGTGDCGTGVSPMKTQAGRLCHRYHTWQRPLAKWGAPLLALTATGALAATAIARNQDYYDQEEMWTALTRDYPQNKRPYCCLAALQKKQGRFDEAIQNFRRVLAISPGYYDANYDLGNLLLDRGQVASAIGYYRIALKIAPRPDNRAAVCNDLGRALLVSGDAAEALQVWREAAALKPDEAGLLNNIAWQLATQSDASLRNGSEAVRLAERACELTANREAGMLDTLAAAYAEAERFAEAVKAAEKACELFPSAEAADARERLELYRQGKAYRQGVN